MFNLISCACQLKTQYEWLTNKQNIGLTELVVTIITGTDEIHAFTFQQYTIEFPTQKKHTAIDSNPYHLLSIGKVDERVSYAKHTNTIFI